MPASIKSPGQIAYEQDVERQPNYHTGEPRRSWAALGEVERWSWERNPTPREYANLPRADHVKSPARVDLTAFALAGAALCNLAGIAWSVSLFLV